MDSSTEQVQGHQPDRARSNRTRTTTAKLQERWRNWQQRGRHQGQLPPRSRNSGLAPSGTCGMRRRGGHRRRSGGVAPDNLGLQSWSSGRQRPPVPKPSASLESLLKRIGQRLILGAASWSGRRGLAQVTASTPRPSEECGGLLRSRGHHRPAKILRRNREHRVDRGAVYSPPGRHRRQRRKAAPAIPGGISGV